MNIVIVSTCEYMFVVTHWIHSMLVACYVLVHWNDMVLNTYVIHQIQVTFYLVSIMLLVTHITVDWSLFYLVNRITLHTHSLYWFIHDNCIIDTFPDECFSCYRLAPDNSKCTNACSSCCLELTLIVSGLNFRFFSFRVCCQVKFLSVSTYLLHLLSL